MAFLGQSGQPHLAGCHLITTDEVLVEVLNAFCAAGALLRGEGIRLVRDLQSDRSVTVHPQSRDSLASGLALYEARPDKQYSLTDCISMATMRREGVTEILTDDHRFVQEGFIKLL